MPEGDEVKGWSAEQFFRWLKTQPPDVREALNNELMKRPDIFIQTVKTIRDLSKGATGLAEDPSGSGTPDERETLRRGIVERGRGMPSVP